MIFQIGIVILEFLTTPSGMLAITAAFVLYAVLRPRVFASACGAVERPLSNLARHRALVVGLVFFGVLAARLLILPFLPVPVPGIHDEFSYLLMADTFTHGRLTNPPHPMWMSFETFHVNWLPTYSSMYPPAQGFVLAIGQWLGHPWIGVLLSAGAMCAAIFWMLQAWMPARWAFLGASLVAMKFGLDSYWINSYWGGAVAATGGALVLGALARIVRRANVGDALLLGLGLAILANSRPYEGFLFSIPVAFAFFWWLAGKTQSRITRTLRIRRTVVPLLAVLTLTISFMGYYNWRLTGNPLLLPHRLNARTYSSASLFVWDTVQPPRVYNNQQFEDFYSGWAREEYQRTWGDFAKVSWLKITRYHPAFFWAGALLVLPGLPFAFGDRRIRLLAIVFLFGLFAIFSVVWSNAHYAAPLTCVFYALIVQAIRHLRTVRLAGRPVGLALSWAVVLLLAFDTARAVVDRECDPEQWTCWGDPSRLVLKKKIEEMPGKYLIVVRYAKHHNVHDEWVYNGADIDGAKTVWARELSPEQNAKLFAYFKDRTVWLVTPDIDSTELLPYSKLPALSNYRASPGEW
jgi:hypothetical protein